MRERGQNVPWVVKENLFVQVHELGIPSFYLILVLSALIEHL